MGISHRICSQCGIPLAPGEVFCSNCGTAYTEPSMIEPTQQRAFPPSQGGYNFPIEPAQPAQPNPPLSPYGSSPYRGNASYGSIAEQNYMSPLSPQSPSNQGYTPLSDTGYSPQPQRDFAPPPPIGAPIVTPGMYQQQPYPSLPDGYLPPIQPRRGPRVGPIVGIVILLALIILGGGGFFFYYQATCCKSNTTQVTPGSTGIPNSTPLFTDTFANNNSNGWAIGNDKGYSSTITNNIMTLIDSNHRVLDVAIPNNNNFTDFSATATFTLVSADQNDSAGLYVRGNDGFNRGYLIDVNGDNSFDIYKLSSSTNNDVYLVHPTRSTAINSVGQQNKLTVTMKGPNITIQINGTVVENYTDTSKPYNSGQIALFAENGNTSSGVKATFSSIVVYPTTK